MAVRGVILMFALAAGLQPAAAGLVFSETEVIDSGAATSRQVRRVDAQDGQVRSTVEESDDALVPAGSYLLVTAAEAVIVDPARSTIAPIDPTDMYPVLATAGQVTAPRRFSGISLELQSDEPGPTLLGLPTWHYVYLLRYQEDSPGQPAAAGAGVLSEERHEFWAAALPDEEASLAAWRELRVAEDAGAGSARRDVREAVAQMYERGFFLRHIIERRTSAPGGATDMVERERVTREVTKFSREDIAAEVFRKPAGYTQTEFLAPEPDETAGPGLNRRGTPGEAGSPGPSAE